MTAPIIDPVERAHMAWESASVDDEPVDKQTWMIIVAGVAGQAAAAEREACAKIVEKLAGADGEYGTRQAQEGKIIAHAIRNRT